MRHALLATTLWLGVAGCVGREDPAGRGDGSGTATPATAPEAGRRVARKAGTMPKVGDVAPEFRVRDHTGKERTLAEFRGKRVVLWFFPKADTPGWTLEGCGFRDRSPEYEKKKVVVLGISFDPVEANRAFAEKYHFPFALLSDPDRTVAVAYGLTTDPKAPYAKRVTFVIGPQGKIEQVIDPVDARSHPDTLLKSLP